jgi:hypothetical protein
MTEERIDTRCELAVVRAGSERTLELVPRELGEGRTSAG